MKMDVMSGSSWMDIICYRVVTGRKSLWFWPECAHTQLLLLLLLQQPQWKLKASAEWIYNWIHQAGICYGETDKMSGSCSSTTF